MNTLTRKAQIYIVGILLVSIGLSAVQLVDVRWQDPVLLGLACLAAILQVLKVEGATSVSSYNLAWMVYGGTFLMMGPEAALFIILVSHIVEWIWHKYPWYVQAFNIASFVVAVSAAGLVYHWINPVPVSLSLLGALGALIGLAVFTLLNHLMLGLVFWLAREQNFRESGVFGTLTLMIDYTLIGLGAGAAMLWMVTPAAAIFSLIPIYLIYSTLKMPALERQAEIDPKTKLFNAKYFSQALERELSRAERFDRPLTLVMGDLDLLRNINNTYGHLAGDVVLTGISKILQERFRGYDIVARFGGEEFAILLPETTADEAHPRIEAARAAIEAYDFVVSTSVTPIKATMSLGIADRLTLDQTADELLHNADVALYHAKSKGRNQVCLYSDDELETLFGLNEREAATPEPPEPLRKPITRPRKPIPIEPAPEEPKPKVDKTISQPMGVPKPEWMVNAYIGFLGLVALGIAFVTVRPMADLDWFGLFVFAIVVVLAEGFSIEIYAKEASVSTAAAPFIAGVLLFGPMGAVLLSLVLAGMAYIKKRSHFKRFFFNISNHFIASSLCAGLFFHTKTQVTAMPPVVQFGLSVISGIVIYLSSTGLLAGVMSLALGKPLLKIWRNQFRWLAPYYLAFGGSAYALVLGYDHVGVIGLLALLVPMLILRYSQVQYISRTETLVAELRSSNKGLEEQQNEISTLNEELLLCLAQAIDIRDPFTFGHSEMAGTYAVLIGRKLGLSPPRIEVVRKAGLLHDIGKLGIPEGILFKPGSLTADEYEKIKQHPAIGADLVAASHSMQDIVPAIRHHHEHWDGGGYPSGLAGKDIPLEARIVGLADAVEAMASDRPYRKGLNFEQIVKEVLENAGTQFDPEVVDAFMQVILEEGESVIVNYSLVMDQEPALAEGL